MKQKIFSLLVLLMTVVTASAQAPAFKLTVGTTNAQGSFAFTVNSSDATPDVNGVIAVNEGDQITVKITANTGWSVNEPSGVWYSTLEAAHARTRGAGSGSESIEVLGDITLSPVANTENTWSFTMMRANAEISCTYKKLLSNTEITIDDIADLTYTGEAQTPAVTVKDDDTPLVENTDFTVTYSNNINAGLSTATENAPTVTITAATTSTKYAGSVTKTFTINKAALTVTADDIDVPFGTATPAYTASYDGFVGDDDESNLGGTLSFESNYTSASAIGSTYTITPSGYTSDNYEFNYETGTLTVVKIEGEIYFDFKSLTKTFGDGVFTRAVINTGNGNVTYRSTNENVAFVYSTLGAIVIRGVGTATIIATVSNSKNYNYTTTEASYTLVVNPAIVKYDGGDIILDENGYDVSLTEGSGSANPLPISGTVDDLDYSRTLTVPGSGNGDTSIEGKKTNLFTICLPFVPKMTDKDGNELDGVTCYTLSSVTGTTLNFSEVENDEVTIFTPYLVAVSGENDITLSCSDVTFSTEEPINSTTVDGYTFNGTFVGMTNADALGKYILQAGNKWGKVTADNTAAFIPPFRAFIEGPANGVRETLVSNFGDNTTGIQNIRTVDLDGTERWYDLNGHRIEKPATKGVYIQDGRKVIVK